MATIRELFHNLGNKHNLITIGCGATKEAAEECLQEKNPEAIKEKLREIQKNLGQIIKSTLEADKIAAEIRDRVYRTINPDNDKLK